jgi:hypothetical protein
MSITVDDLVNKLRAVRIERQMIRVFEAAYGQITTDPSFKSKKIKRFNTNNVNNTFEYINHHMRLGISEYMTENDKANTLWDFANIPREMVYDRIIREGGCVCPCIF